MEQSEFLEKNVFNELKNLNEGSDKETNHHFSEADFEVLLERIEHLGIGMYIMESFLDGKSIVKESHEDFKKKATDPRWYKKAFLTSKFRQAGLTYSGTYKVSNKLLAR
jgi:hypothetical protein